MKQVCKRHNFDLCHTRHKYVLFLINAWKVKVVKVELLSLLCVFVFDILTFVLSPCSIFCCDVAAAPSQPREHLAVWRLCAHHGKVARYVYALCRRQGQFNHQEKCHSYFYFADSSSQPKVKFPKSLLTITEKTNISSVTAYLTVPQHHLAKDCVNCTPGIISNKSGNHDNFKLTWRTHI